MSQRKKHIIFTVIVVALTWGYVDFQRMANVYPGNETAQLMPVTYFKYTPDSRSVGKLEAHLASGEKLQGEYRANTGKQQSDEDKDAIYELRNPDLSLSNSYKRLVHMSHGAKKDRDKEYKARLYGDKGTVMDCEYFITAFGHEGIGSCRSSFGALYNLFF